MAGWIKIYRELLDKAIWVLSSPQQKTILITLLLMANHEEKEWEWRGKRFVCKPGQMITSLDKIAKEAGKGISIQNVRTAILRFEKFGFLTNESTKQNRLITICNWGFYQNIDEKDNNVDNNQLTNDQQRANNHLTTNKNDKNDKNVRMKEDIDIRAKRTAFVPPTIEEVSNHIKEKGYSIDAESFVAFYDSKGWMVGKNKMKSWKSALTTWEKRSAKEKTSYERKRHTGLSRIPSSTEGAYEGDL